MDLQGQVLVGGSVAIDNVKTPSSEETQLLGGSASYAALAAAKMGAKASMLGIIGADFPSEHLEMLSAEGVDLSQLTHSEDDSFTWSGEYHENMNDRTTHAVSTNVLEDWEVKVPDGLRNARFVVLANMSPQNQLQLINQLDESPRFIVADSMDLWITIAQSELLEVLQRVDLFVINETEARQFAETNNLIQAGKFLLNKGPKYVVVKLGEFGAYLFGPDGQFFRCGAYPLEEVADPTGAGDTFLGGLVGYLAKGGEVDPNFEQIREAVVQGSVLASFTCEDFSTRKLEKVDSGVLTERYSHFQAISAF